ncbi:LLM class flavin-dependent oxidoreductase [Streptomyces sp. NPDC059009]|uniref:LLM class flavin-dependent oxidoreductase n=1 Tax=Streptomyces sp. NPDC059009 TaxID=3346694 RepID=UPI0036D0F6D8
MRLDAVMWPDSPWTEARAEWRTAEELGLGGGWIYDHLFWKQGRPWHEAYTTLAAVAATTSRIGMGTMVTSPNFRHPVTSAKAAFTLNDISGGRFTLGIGAGGPGGDADVLGEPGRTRAQRTARFEEWVELTDLLLSQDATTHQGAHFSARDVAIGADNTPATRPPLAVAATGKRGMALAARFADQWLTQDISQDPKLYAGTPYAEIERQTALLDEVCRAHGRDPSTLPRLCVLGYGEERPLDSLEAFRDCAGRYGELGISTIAVLWPRGADAAAQMKVLEEAAAELAS